MQIKPTNDLLLIRRIVADQPKTASGILLPPVEESADTPYRGVVVAAGPGKPAKASQAAQEVIDALQSLVDAYHGMPNINWPQRGIGLATWQRAIDALKSHNATSARLPMQVNVGDTVVFSKNGYQEFKVDGETLIALGEASCLGVVESL